MHICIIDQQHCSFRYIQLLVRYRPKFSSCVVESMVKPNVHPALAIHDRRDMLDDMKKVMNIISIIQNMGASVTLYRITFHG